MPRSPIGALLILVFAPLAAAEVAYGHRDFYPSPERPIGFCGDGNGWYPGAAPVSEFWEGTPVKTTMPFHDKRKGRVEEEAWDLGDAQGKNIAWKTRMPSWSNSQPIVVGDRVFTQYEPYGLVCCDAASGAILWSVEVDPWSAAGCAPEVAARAKGLHEVWMALPFWPAMLKSSTVYRALRGEEWQHLLPIWEGQVLPRILAELERLDPGQDWAGAAATSLDALKLQRDGLLAGEEKISLPRNAAESLHKMIEGRIQALTRDVLGNPREGFRARMNLSWGWEVGTMVAPVSDGRRVFAESAHGVTFCCDLAGRVVWARFFPDDQRTPCQSPLLAGGVLVSMHGGAGVLRGLDAATGTTLWETPTKSEQSGKHKGGYYVGAHKALRLSNGSSSETVIVTTLCNIIRARDGKVVGHLPWDFDYGPSGGPSVVNVGDVVFRASNGDGGGTPMNAYRLSLLGPDEVRAEVAYQVGKGKSSPGYSQFVTTDRFAIIDGGRDNPNILAGADGAVIQEGGRDRIGGLSDILAGTTCFWAEEGNRGQLSSWGGRRHDGKALALFHSVDLSDPSAPKRLSDRNLLGGSDFPAMPAMERLAPELYADPMYASSAWGKPCHRLHTDCAITACGNRLFIRTVSDLYAIGDPSVPYDWNPASRPAEIAAGLE